MSNTPPNRNDDERPDEGTRSRREASRRRFLGGSASLVGASTVLSLGGSVAAEEHEADEEPPSPEDTPEAERGLTREEIQEFVEVFDDQPMGGGQEEPYTPGYVWKWISEDTFLFLEFEEDDPQEAETLRYIGYGVKGTFCQETRPDPGAGGSAVAGDEFPFDQAEDAPDEAAADAPEGETDLEPWPHRPAPENEFTYFHQLEAEEWDQAHGGDPGQEGYWLAHMAVDEFERPWGEVTPGVDYNYMPTDPPECDEPPEPEFEPEEAGMLEEDEMQELLGLFDDMPMEGGQEDPFTPKHVWKWITDDVFMGLELEHPNPEMAEMVNYFFLGVRDEFTEDRQPHPDFTHFHRRESPTWPAAHGHFYGADGYWFIHSAVREFRQPWGYLEPGVDRNYAPTFIDEGQVDAEPEAPDEEVTEVRTVQTGEEMPPFAFEPLEVEIDAGETVRWTNTDGEYHTVTSTRSHGEKVASGRFNGILYDEGDTFEHTFEEPGEYHYFCGPHAGFMFGTVLVGEAAEEDEDLPEEADEAEDEGGDEMAETNGTD